MSSIYDRAAQATICDMLNAGGYSLVGAGAVSMVAGGAGIVPVTVGGLALLAENLLCNPFTVDGNDTYNSVFGCTKIDGGYGYLEQRHPGGGPGYEEWGPISESQGWNDPGLVTEILSEWRRELNGRYAKGLRYKTIKSDLAGGAGPYWATVAEAERAQFRLIPISGTCVRSNDDPPPPPPEIYNPVPYTDPDTGCNLNVTFAGFVQETPGGPLGTAFKIEAADQPQQMASGSIIGGCNIEPVINYQPPGGGGGTTIPWDPTWDGPSGGDGFPWKDLLKAALSGLVAGATEEALESFFNRPLPATSFTINAACEFKEDGTPEEYTINFPEQSYQDRVLDALTAQTEFAQQFFLWKTPICEPCRTPVTGEPVTLNWISDEPSPVSGRKLKKILTYFDQSGSGLEAHVEHWRNFTWQAGPIVVSPCECELGRPQVWAASESEGKRVINHAAAISGVDLTKVEWIVSTPASARLGVGGTMRIHRDKSGILGVTKRAGSSGLPMGLS